MMNLMTSASAKQKSEQVMQESRERADGDRTHRAEHPGIKSKIPGAPRRRRHVILTCSHFIMLNYECIIKYFYTNILACSLT